MTQSKSTCYRVDKQLPKREKKKGSKTGVQQENKFEICDSLDH